jgi:hypothetical protein
MADVLSTNYSVIIMELHRKKIFIMILLLMNKCKEKILKIKNAAMIYKKLFLLIRSAAKYEFPTLFQRRIHFNICIFHVRMIFTV